jgi:hypothetical protein
MPEQHKIRVGFEDYVLPGNDSDRISKDPTQIEVHQRLLDLGFIPAVARQWSPLGTLEILYKNKSQTKMIRAYYANAVNFTAIYKRISLEDLDVQVS